MGISHQIEAVYQRALQLREQATTNPVEPELLEQALKELYFVLEELQAVDVELHQQNQALTDTRAQIDLERQRYRTLFELAPDAYLVTDEKGKIYQANRAAEALFSLPQEGLVGKPLLPLIELGDWPGFQQRLANPTPTEPWEVKLIPRQSESVAVAITTNRLKDRRKGADTILWSLRDISDQRLMEQRLKAAYDDLEDKVRLTTENARLRQELSECRQGKL
ncbi:PAS domain-containing protein [Leptolyngbya sp. CCNP1308]|uniref:PAS domain-containing protein n=1 Tax=Leptolyngbya sp. CCNP1308 TaxID=3110255 RepID=UPI002B21F28C|nr:PAS domain-containing protein [Leptolyngbya sp. CCNP1308]MEA5448809.1 PAS domain-containing protein [Leptolyngbya sp. CCNP1308]